jgi:hypothetical protein
LPFILTVIPAEAGIQATFWMPAFAGMTSLVQVQEIALPKQNGRREGARFSNQAAPV